jgi:hypothetical protein
VISISCTPPAVRGGGYLVVGVKKTAYNRSVYASPPVGGSGFRSLLVVPLRSTPTAHSTHILPALVLLRKPLFGLAKRRKQSC